AGGSGGNSGASGGAGGSSAGASGNGGAAGSSAGANGNGGAAGAASSTLVTLAFAGHVHAVTQGLPSQVIAGIPAVGDPVTGTLVYDVTTPTTTPTSNQYQLTDAGIGQFLHSGGWR